MTTAVLLEVGLHNPLAAAIGRHGESEWALAQRLLAQLPKHALLLGDRLYGVIAFARVAQQACQRVGSHFLLRASRSVKPRLIRRLARRHSARRPSRSGPRDNPTDPRVARSPRDSRAGRAEGPPRARAAVVDQLLDPRRRPRWNSRASMRVAGNTNCTFGK